MCTSKYNIFTDGCPPVWLSGSALELTQVASISSGMNNFIGGHSHARLVLENQTWSWVPHPHMFTPTLWELRTETRLSWSALEHSGDISLFPKGRCVYERMGEPAPHMGTQHQVYLRVNPKEIIQMSTSQEVNATCESSEADLDNQATVPCDGEGNQRQGWFFTLYILVSDPQWIYGNR